MTAGSKTLFRIADLNPHPQNPNRHSPQEVALIRQSLRKFGVYKPLVVWFNSEDKRWYTLTGHCVAEAAAQEGMGEVWVEDRSDLSSTQALALMAGDNEIARQLSYPDQDDLSQLIAAVHAEDESLAALAAGGEDELRRLLEMAGQEPMGAPEAQIDKAAELQEKWQVKPGDIFIAGEQKLICGDCTDRATVERLMGGEKAALGFADPPFNVDYEYIAYDDKRRDYPQFTRQWIELMAEAINDGWLFVMNITKNLELTLVELSRVSCFGNLIVWPHGTGAIPSNRFALGWQAIAAYRKGEAIFNAKAEVMPTVISDERGGGINPRGRVTDVWDDIRPVVAGSRAVAEAILEDGRKAKIHHAQMPIALPERAIKFGTKQGMIVLDPFLGSGTTLVACQRLGRRGRGIEICAPYVSVALQRLQDMGLEVKRVE